MAKTRQYIIPIATSVLEAPFASAYPPLLDAAVQVFEAIILNVWPRVDYHRGDILEGLLICWCKLLNESTSPSHASARVRFKIEKVVRLMTAYLKAQRNITDDYRTLIATDSRLEVLFIS